MLSDYCVLGTEKLMVIFHMKTQFQPICGDLQEGFSSPDCDDSMYGTDPHAHAPQPAA